MELSLATLGLAFLAGLVTTLSPCVLPLLPIIAGTASGRSWTGLVALAAGLAVAFTAVGVTVASSGHLLGIDEQLLRRLAGLLLLGVAAVLLSERLQAGFTRLSAGLGDWGNRGLGNIRGDGAGAQFLIGALMGVAWSPCVGPTLGAAIALAAGGEGLLSATAVMASFSVAAVVPLTAAGLLSRSAFQRRRERLANAGRWGKRLLGLSLAVVGLLVLSGYDKQLEALLLGLAPDWLTRLTTRF